MKNGAAAKTGLNRAIFSSAWGQAVQMETVDEEEFLHPPWLAGTIVSIELESKEVYSEGIALA